MATGAARAPWRVLVVDDEENLNWSLVNSLQKEGYPTEGAHTGEDALRLLSTNAYDCVISDVKMPGMDGFELLQWLRQHRPQTRVMMMTAFGSPTARQEALRGGVVAYLEKPFDLRALKDELRRLTTETPAAQNGEADGYDLLEVARVLNLSRRDIALNVQGGGYTGALRFQRGELLWAEAGALRGEAAFMALCMPRGGRAQPEAWDGRTERNVTVPVSRLIYQALSQREGRPIGVSGGLPLASASTPAVPAGSDRNMLRPAPAVSTVSTQMTPQQAPVPEENGGLAVADQTARTDDPAGAAQRPPAGAGRGSDLAPPPSILPAAASATGESVADADARMAAMPEREAEAAPQPPTHGNILRELASALPAPCGVVALRLDGTVLGQAWNARAETPMGAYTHLASAAQAASRALLLGDLGVIDDVRISTTDHGLVIRRISRGDRAALLVAILARDVSLSEAAELLRTRTPDVLEALR